MLCSLWLARPLDGDVSGALVRECRFHFLDYFLFISPLCAHLYPLGTRGMLVFFPLCVFIIRRRGNLRKCVPGRHVLYMSLACPSNLYPFVSNPTKRNFFLNCVQSVQLYFRAYKCWLAWTVALFPFSLFEPNHPPLLSRNTHKVLPSSPAGSARFPWQKENDPSALSMC